MNKDKFEKKVNKKYGISSQELSSKTIKEAKVLQETHKQEIKNEKKGITDTPTAKARRVLIYIYFQIYSKVHKTNEFL